MATRHVSIRAWCSPFSCFNNTTQITRKRNRYTPGEPKVLGTFQPTENWEDTFAQRRIDVGKFYASKDNDYPTTTQGETRRINWGWAQTPPQSTQTLPREITFNAAARVLQQAPIEELKQLRQGVAYQAKDLSLKSGSSVQMNLKTSVAKQSEVIVNFELPKSESTFGISIGKPGSENPGTKVTTYMEKTDLPGGNDYNITHYPANTSPSVCADACEADSKCQSWTYVIRGLPAGSGDCCLKSSVPCPVTSGGASASCKFLCSKRENFHDNTHSKLKSRYLGSQNKHNLEELRYLGFDVL